MLATWRRWSCNGKHVSFTVEIAELCSSSKRCFAPSSFLIFLTWINVLRLVGKERSCKEWLRQNIFIGGKIWTSYSSGYAKKNNAGSAPKIKKYKKEDMVQTVLNVFLACIKTVLWSRIRKVPHHFGGAGALTRCSSDSDSTGSKHKQTLVDY
jgi:hypothetical protein